MVPEHLDLHMKKSKHKSYTRHKNLLKMDQKPKRKMQNYKTPRR